MQRIISCDLISTWMIGSHFNVSGKFKGGVGLPQIYSFTHSTASKVLEVIYDTVKSANGFSLFLKLILWEFLIYSSHNTWIFVAISESSLYWVTQHLPLPLMIAFFGCSEMFATASVPLLPTAAVCSTARWMRRANCRVNMVLLISVTPTHVAVLWSQGRNTLAGM